MLLVPVHGRSVCSNMYTYLDPSFELLNYFHAFILRIFLPPAVIQCQMKSKGEFSGQKTLRCILSQTFLIFSNHGETSDISDI